jgi:peroxiredoxin
MKQKVLTLFSAAVIMCCASITDVKAMGHGDHEGEGHKAEMSMAPDFTATDAAGEVINLSDFKGKMVVLEWVNFDCPYVKKHYNSGNMQALQASYTEQDVVWIGVGSSAEGKQGYFTGDDLVAKKEMNNFSGSHYIVDASGEIGKLYDAKTTPHMFIIGTKGELVYEGAIDSVPSADKSDVESAENYVVSALDAYMAGEEIKTAKTQPYGCSVKY